MNTKPRGPVSGPLAEMVEAELKRRGWSMNRAATETGLPYDAFRSLLRGHKPNVDRADALLRVLHCSMVIGIKKSGKDPPNGTEEATAEAENTPS